MDLSRGEKAIKPKMPGLSPFSRRAYYGLGVHSMVADAAIHQAGLSL
jgi:hypothetical protein